jgi:hypothetical protein
MEKTAYLAAVLLDRAEVLSVVPLIPLLSLKVAVVEVITMVALGLVRTVVEAEGEADI